MRNIFLTTLYALFQLTQGLLLHPYQTMQTVTRDKVFSWLTLTPSGVLSLVTILWRFIVVPTVRLVFSCQTSSFWLCDWLPFFSNWLTFFCLFWQVLLIYLYWRFSLSFKK